MRTVLIAAVLLVGCGKSAEERAKEDSEAEDKKAGNPDPKPTPSSQDKERPEPKLQPKKEKKEEELPPHADPKTPEQIEQNRQWAMNKGRTKDTIRYCEMTKFEGKNASQARLGCTFAACREKDAEHAKQFAKDITKDLKPHAIKACAAANITLD